MKHLTEQTQDLAFTNYKTFVETADISRAIMKDLGKSKDSLTKVIDTIPEFVEQCENFSQISGSIMQEKRFLIFLLSLYYYHLSYKRISGLWMLGLQVWFTLKEWMIFNFLSQLSRHIEIGHSKYMSEDFYVENKAY